MGNLEARSWETLNIADLFYHDFSSFVGEDATFVYDSDAKGPGEGGMNILGGKVPLRDYFTPSFIPENAISALTLFRQTCHDIENAYGHIKVHCYPSKIGNKIKIRLKDYASFPPELEPLGSIDQDGGSTSVDSSYNIEKDFVEAIEVSMSKEADSLYNVWNTR
jgi:hypothetical protein